MNRQRFLQDGLIGEQSGRPVLIAHKCKECEQVSFPGYQRCPYCGSEHSEDYLLADKGVVLAETTTHALVPPYKPPFTLALVDIEDKVRILTQLHPVDGKLPQAGDEVFLRTGVLFEETVTDRKTKVTETVEVVGYYFVAEQDRQDGEKE